jgi:hypothetical protein
MRILCLFSTRSNTGEQKMDDYGSAHFDVDLLNENYGDEQNEFLYVSNIIPRNLNRNHN